MQRASYSGAVRDSDVEAARDLRILRLYAQGLTMGVIAQRMGVSTASVRVRLKRLRDLEQAARVGA